MDILNNTWYEYQLEGFDKQWSLTSQTSLKYTNLDPGDYVLHVRQKGNSLKMRKAQEILLQIHINTPWYLTWWAWFSYITISISVTYFIWREKVPEELWRYYGKASLLLPIIRFFLIQLFK